MDAVKKPDAEAVCKYVAGYNECATQVTQYLTSLPASDGDRLAGNKDKLLTNDTRCSLLDHLANSLHQSAVAASSQHDSSSTSVNLSTLSPALYVISPQQVPVTSSAQLRVLPAKLSSGQFVLLLADTAATADQQTDENSRPVKLDSCDVIALKPGDRHRPTDICDCTADHVPVHKSDTGCVSQSESSPAARDEQQNTDDLPMWRPW